MYNNKLNKFVVVEKRFVISPEKSGKLIIPPTKVEGRIALTGGDSSTLRKRMDEGDMLNELFFDLNNRSTFSNPFDPFFSRRSIGPTRPFSVNSESIEVNVLPVPDSFKGSAWLPAEEIKMKDSWAENPPELVVGEPVTRNIIMQVKGLASSQIPEIPIPKPAGIKVYPEQTKTETPNDGNTIYGIQRVDISYIPNVAGKVTIPEIQVDWWDVNSKKQRTYTLPAWNLNVAPAIGADSAAVDVDPMTVADPLIEDTPESDVSKGIGEIHQSKYWRWEILLGEGLICFAVLWGLYQLLKRFKVSPRRKNVLEQKQKMEELKRLKTELVTACNSNDKQNAAKYLLDYARLTLDDSRLQNIGSLASKLILGNEIVRELEKSLYAPNNETWKGEKLIHLINQGLKIKEAPKKLEQHGLAPLYPN